MKFTQLAAALAASLLVSACGGGGGSDNGGQPAASAKYVGSWTTPCFESVFAASTAPTVNLMSTTSFVFTRVSDTVLSVVVQPKVYSTPDCSGAAVDLPPVAGASSLTITGAATISGKPVDKVIFHFAAIDPGFSAGTTINLNGILLPGDYFTSSDEWKDLTLVEGNAITFGGDTLDAEGYPTTLVAAPTLSRLPWATWPGRAVDGAVVPLGSRERHEAPGGRGGVTSGHPSSLAAGATRDRPGCDQLGGAESWREAPGVDSLTQRSTVARPPCEPRPGGADDRRHRP